MLTKENALKTKIPSASMLTIGELKEILPPNGLHDHNAVFDAVFAAFKIGYRRGLRNGKKKAAAGKQTHGSGTLTTQPNRLKGA